MQVKNNITERDLKLATEILQEACPQLSESKLVQALKNYNDGREEKRESGRMIDKNEAAGKLGVSTFTVVRMLKSGRLPGKKIGRQWRIPSDKLDEVIESVSDGDAEDEQHTNVN